MSAPIGKEIMQSSTMSNESCKDVERLISYWDLMAENEYSVEDIKTVMTKMSRNLGFYAEIIVEDGKVAQISFMRIQ
jgi:hypothetical protein